MLDLGVKRFAEARERLNEAITWQRKALAANPADSASRQFLAIHLRGLIEVADGLGDDRQAQHRYNASCAAALAAAGVGKDEPPPDDAEKERLRKQVRDWLRQELEVWNKFLASATPEQRAEVARILNHWRDVDPDLAGIRDRDALAKLPEAERAEWDAFWAGVDAALAQVRGE